MIHCHITQDTSFDLNLLGIGLPHHFSTCFKLFFIQDVSTFKHRDTVSRHIFVEHQWSRYFTVQTTTCSFSFPLIGIPVSIKMNSFALLYIFSQFVIYSLHCTFTIGNASIDSRFKGIQLIGDSCVENGHCTCTVG